jgi:hypothetical protein
MSLASSVIVQRLVWQGCLPDLEDCQDAEAPVPRLARAPRCRNSTTPTTSSTSAPWRTRSSYARIATSPSSGIVREFTNDRWRDRGNRVGLNTGGRKSREAAHSPPARGVPKNAGTIPLAGHILAGHSGCLDAKRFDLVGRRANYPRGHHNPHQSASIRIKSHQSASIPPRTASIDITWGIKPHQFASKSLATHGERGQTWCRCAGQRLQGRTAIMHRTDRLKLQHFLSFPGVPFRWWGACFVGKPRHIQKVVLRKALLAVVLRAGRIG